MLDSFYLEIKYLHISLVTLSILLFSFRSLLTLRHYPWKQKWPKLIFTPHIVDTFLLLSGASLALITHTPIYKGWLGTKLLFLLAYILFGTVSLKYAKTPLQQGLSAIAALSCVAIMIKIALSKTFF